MCTPFDSMRKATKDGVMNAPSPEEINARFETFTSRVEERMQSVVDLVKEEGELNKKRFDRIDQRFDLVDQRFDRADLRFERLDIKVDRVDMRIDSVDDRVGAVDQRFVLFDERLGRLEDDVDRLHAIMLKLPYITVGAILTTVAIMTFVLNFATPLARLRTQTETQAAPTTNQLAEARLAHVDTKQRVWQVGVRD